MQASFDFAIASQKLRNCVGSLVVCGHGMGLILSGGSQGGSQALLSFLRPSASRTTRRHRRKGARNARELRRTLDDDGGDSGRAVFFWLLLSRPSLPR